MKRSDIKNKRLMSALTIGISAMMALSTPISAYANENGEPTGDGGGDNNTQAEQSHSEHVEESHVTQEAQDQADVVQEVTTENADSAQAEATQAAEPIIDAAAEAAILEAATEEVGSVASQVIEEVVQAAAAVVKDETNEAGEITTPSAVTELQNASDTMNEVKADLKEADKQDTKAEQAVVEIKGSAKDAGDNYKAAEVWAENIYQDTVEAQENAEQLVKDIQEAKTEEEAVKAYEDLSQLVESSESQLKLKQEHYNNLLAKYNQALKELQEAEQALADAEKAYEENLDKAKDKAVSAQDEIDSAKTKVDNLESALNKAEDKLQAEAEAAEAVQNAYGKISGGNQWGPKREAAYQAIVGYVIPQLEGKEITDVHWEHVTGFDTQDCNYNVLTYKENGVPVTRYFNYDNLDKKDNGNKYGDLGKSWGIAVFEKTEDEIRANKLLKDTYGTVNFGIQENKDKNNQGFYDVFAYGEGEDREFITREKLQSMIDSKEISVAEDGTMTITVGDKKVAVDQVVQNKNSLIHDANVHIIAGTNDFGMNKYGDDMLETLSRNRSQEEAQDIFDKLKAENEAYNNEFLTNHLYDSDGKLQHVEAEKYSGYSKAAKEAQSAVKEAQDEAERLTEAIDDLKKERKTRSVLAKDALGVEDVATYLGLEVSAEEAEQLNKMNVRDAIKVFDEYLEKANDKIDDATRNMEDLQESYKAALDDFNAAIKRLTPRPGRPVVPSSVIEAESNAGGGDSVVAGDIVLPPGAVPGAVIAAAAQTGGGAAVQTPGGAGGAGATEVQADAGAVAQAGGGAAVEANGGADVEVVQGEAEAPSVETVSIAEEEVALTDTVKEPDMLDEAIIALAEDETPLSDSPVMPAKPGKMSWWWALIILILGERGRELYVKYKKDLKDEQ